MTDALIAVIAGGPSTAGVTERTCSNDCGEEAGLTKPADVGFIFIIAVLLGFKVSDRGLSRRRPRNNDGKCKICQRVGRKQRRRNRTPIPRSKECAKTPIPKKWVER